MCTNLHFDATVCKQPIHISSFQTHITTTLSLLCSLLLPQRTGWLSDCIAWVTPNFMLDIHEFIVSCMKPKYAPPLLAMSSQVTAPLNFPSGVRNVHDASFHSSLCIWTGYMLCNYMRWWRVTTGNVANEATAGWQEKWLHSVESECLILL